jgi:diguanylate cyclase (GGDEF)-like protein
MSFILTGLAGFWQAVQSQSSSARTLQLPVNKSLDFRLRPWTTYLPYGFLAISYLLLIVSHSYTFPIRFSFVAIWVGSIIGLVLTRQIATLNENSRLSVELQQALTSARLQAAQLDQANRELQVEIEERRRAEERLAHDALYDALTGLPNRTLLADRLKHAIQYARRHKDYHFSVLFLDLDQFKVVNDSLGHPVGDELLVALSLVLNQCVRTSDTIARLGGDEFVILLEDTLDRNIPIQVANRIQESLNTPFALVEKKVFISASIGIVCAKDEYDDPEEVLRDADIAMYHAKALGKARFEIFTPGLRERAMSRLELENDLRQALERQELSLHYQPILSLRSNQIVGFESLLRWHHPKRGFISPAEFIPVAEETGLILPIGRWVLEKACRQMREWQTANPKQPPLTISVNISGSQFKQPDLVEQIEAVLKETGLDGSSLGIEITESVYLNSPEEAVAIFARLNALGIQFLIDDFGTGYSSLSYLQYFPINTIKIDRTFISRMNGPNHSELVQTIVALAHDLGMDAVAEGIETEAQLDLLRGFGCNYGQGFLLCPPIATGEVDQLLRKPTMPASGINLVPANV